MSDIATGRTRMLDINALRPNNWYINRAKLNRMRSAWRAGTQDRLPPVCVTIIDGQYSLVDGHSRAYAAFETGAMHIQAVIQELDQIEGSAALYTHIHREGPGMGIRTLADLQHRIVSARTHRRLWVGYCTRWLAQNKPAADSRSGNLPP